MGATLCASTAATVLIINIVLTIWATKKNGTTHGLATIQDGSCQKTKNLSLWLHLAINVLSTMLLAASNYCMQCLSSPTREEVDKAHTRHVWLDIGVPSVRNLGKISRRRTILWWLLAFSGIPLHLLYNSAVFSTLAAQEYGVYAASEEFANGAGLNWSYPITDTPYTNPGNASLITLDYFKNASRWQNLTNEECIQAYGQSFVSAHGNVLAVTSALNASVPMQVVRSYTDFFIADDNGGQPPYVWMCTDPQDCDPTAIRSKSKDWTIYGEEDDSAYPVQYCISQPVEEHCRLQLSLAIMLIVIACNVVKTLCMLLVLRHQTSAPLVTLGDAIESFLSHRDETTAGMCLAEKKDFSSTTWIPSARVHTNKHYRWFSSASLNRWLLCNVLCISTLVVAGSLLAIGLSNKNLLSRNIAYLWRMGFGAVTSESMASLSVPGSNGSSGILLIVLIANAPQALLSFLFLTYNGLFTCMLLAEEWSGYAHKRKSLRVTVPVGNQRSTYRLQLPYKYGIPLLILSGTLHWLVSQSLFLARVSGFSSSGVEDPEQTISTIGYSNIAIITVIIIGVIVVILGILNGFRKYKPGMPLAGSCSAAISAACHQPGDDVDAATLPVMWGVVGTKGESGEVGHCSFTTFETALPLEGEVYAGLTQERSILAAAAASDERVVGEFRTRKMK